MIETFKKITKSGWTNLKRNSYISFGATGTIAITLILFLGLLSLQFLTNHIVTSLQDKVDVSVYFKTDTPEDQILKAKKDTEALADVERVNYISRDQALNDFKARHAKDQLIQDSLAQLDNNPLQASLNIKSKDPTKYPDIVRFLEGSKYKDLIDKINFYENQGVINRIQSISSGAQNWGLAVTLILGLIAVLVTFNTIRLTIYNQRQEIEIMRLVGASNWYIRGPYLAEGGFYGLFAAIISLVVFYPVVYFVSGKISVFVPTVDLFGYFVSSVGQIVLLTVALGIALGVISSSITISRHLKV